jgi:hypothetical protein
VLCRAKNKEQRQKTKEQRAKSKEQELRLKSLEEEVKINVKISTNLKTNNYSIN